MQTRPASCVTLTAVCGSVQYPDRSLVHRNARLLRPTGARLVSFTQLRERSRPTASSPKLRLFSHVCALAIDGIGLALTDEQSMGEQPFSVRFLPSGASEERTRLLRRWYGSKHVIKGWLPSGRRKLLTCVSGRDYIIAWCNQKGDEQWSQSCPAEVETTVSRIDKRRLGRCHEVTNSV